MKTDLPRVLGLMVTHACNLRCRMCDTGQAYLNPNSASQLQRHVSLSTASADAMPPAGWLSVVDQFRELSPNGTIAISGGEPLLYPELTDLMHHILRSNIDLRIVTNGTLLQDVAHRFAQLASIKPFAVDVSIDGDENVHDAVRGIPGCYSRTVRGLEGLIAQTSGRVTVSVTTTISDLNYRHLAEGVRSYLRRFGPHLAGIRLYHCWYRTAEIAESHTKRFPSYPAYPANLTRMRVADIDLGILWEQLQALREYAPDRIRVVPDIDRNGMQTYYQAPDLPVVRRRCAAPFRKLTVTPAGNTIVNAICFSGSLGNVQDIPLAEIWQGVALRRFRALVKEPDLAACHCR